MAELIAVHPCAEHIIVIAGYESVLEIYLHRWSGGVQRPNEVKEKIHYDKIN